MTLPAFIIHRIADLLDLRDRARLALTNTAYLHLAPLYNDLIFTLQNPHDPIFFTQTFPKVYCGRYIFKMADDVYICMDGDYGYIDYTSKQIIMAYMKHQHDLFLNGTAMIHVLQQFARLLVSAPTQIAKNNKDQFGVVVQKVIKYISMLQGSIILSSDRCRHIRNLALAPQ